MWFLYIPLALLLGYNDMGMRFLSFGGPSRKCIGMHTAWLSMCKVLASFYLDFDVRVLDELDGRPGPGGHRWVERGMVSRA